MILPWLVVLLSTVWTIPASKTTYSDGSDAGVIFIDYEEEKKSNPDMQCLSSGPRQSKMLCTKGFPESLSRTVTDFDISDVDLPVLGVAPHPGEPEFVFSNTLRKLAINNCSIATIRSHIFRNVPSLRILDLSWNRIVTLTKLSVRHLNAIEEINFSHNRIVYIEKTALKQMLQLKRLDLSYNRIAELDVALPQFLTSLNLFHNELREISSSLELPELVSLDFCKNPVKTIHPSLQLPNLKEICISACNTDVVESTLNITSFHQVEDFALNGIGSTSPPLSRSAGDVLKTFAFLKRLSVVDYSLTSLAFLPMLLGCKEVELGRVVVIEPIPHDCFKNVVILDLSGSPQLVRDIITRTDVLTQMTSIERLTLQNCDLLTLNWFVQLAQMPSLQSCNVGRNVIDCSSFPSAVCQEEAKGPRSRLSGLETCKCSPVVPSWSVGSQEYYHQHFLSKLKPAPLVLAKLCQPLLSMPVIVKTWTTSSPFLNAVHNSSSETHGTSHPRPWSAEGVLPRRHGFSVHDSWRKQKEMSHPVSLPKSVPINLSTQNSLLSSSTSVFRHNIPQHPGVKSNMGGNRKSFSNHYNLSKTDLEDKLRRSHFPTPQSLSTHFPTSEIGRLSEYVHWHSKAQPVPSTKNK